MINKKRLAMIAVAASMILPTNLAYLYGMTPISVLAATTATELPTPVSGTITLSEDTSYTLADSLSIEENTTIELNGQTITFTKGGFSVQAGKTLSISGSGKIISTAQGNGAIVLNGDSTLSIEGESDNSIEIEAFNGIGLAKDAVGSTVTVENVQLTASMYGIYNNGELADGDTSIEVSTSTIEGKVGIYQAGPMSLTITDSTVKGTQGAAIETRAGTLEVSGSTIEGSKENEFEIRPNTGGPTTYRTGLVVAPHNTEAGKRIEVTVSSNTEISGFVGVAIINPLNVISEDTAKVTIEDSILKGESEGYDIVYSAECISFELKDTTLKNNKLQKVDLSGIAMKDGTTEPIDENEEIPYTIINTPTKGIPSNTIEAIAQENEGIVVVDLGEEVNLPNSYKNLPLSCFQEDGTTKDLNSDTLATALTKKSGEETTVTDKEGNALAPGYTFEVTLDEENDKLTASSDGITLDGTPVITVKLQDNSVLKLVPPTAEAQSTQVMTMLEDGELDDGEASGSEVYVSVQDDMKGTKSVDAINTYLAQNIEELGGLYHVDTDKFTGDLNESLPITGDDAVTLDDNGFIEIALATGAAPTESTGNTGSSSRPSKPKPKPEQPAEEPVVATPTSMYRLYNKLTGEHLYTIDKKERDNLLTSDTWKDEGEGWIAPSVSDYPVYRLLNPNNGDHHYTTDKNEFDTLPSLGWVAEGVAFFSADKNNAENVILHRLYNPNAKGAGSHHYTADTNERDSLVAQGWTYEGLAWAGLPTNK